MQDMVRLHVSAFVFALTFAGAPASTSAQLDRTHAASPEGLAGTVAIRDLAGVRRLTSPLVRRRDTLNDTERAAAWADVSQICEAILGRPLDPRIGFDELTGGGSPSALHTAATAGVAARDAAAYVLLSVGYSPRETADIVAGRVSVEALDTARRIRAAGLGRERAADYLDREYRRVAALMQQPKGSVSSAATALFDAVIDKHSRAYGVDAALVRAIIDVESGYSPTAVSRAGAIGLMQLMPATARELAVNPYVPEQNIEGGVRYFAALLKMFGKIELALVAYNGGPGYAQRYAAGHAVLYGETRAYVRSVLDRVNARDRMR